MITTMKQITMVAQTKDKELTLDALAELGLVHLENFQYSSPEVDDALVRKNRADTAYNFLRSFKNKKDLTPPSLKASEAVEIILELKDEMQETIDQDEALAKQIVGLEGWGDFDPADFKFLANKGYHLKIYTIAGGKIDNVSDLEGDAVVLREDKKGLVFAHLTREPLKLDDYEELHLPQQSLSAMRAEKNKLEAKIAELTSKAELYYHFLPVLHAHLEELDSNLQYQVAKANTVDEGNLAAVIGYLPADETEKAQDWARQNSIALAITEPDSFESVPTLIRNPRWLQIVEPVFKFMGTVPGYQELDISLVFLCFFTVFFAMIIGDAAYGSIFFLAGLGMLIYYRKSKKEKPPLAVVLFTILGLATVIWGSMIGSWFGSPELIKGTFLDILVIRQLTEGFSYYTPSGELYKELRSQDVIILLSFCIALTHLTIAQVWNFLRALAQRSLQAVGQVGWMLINFGLFYLVLDMVASFNLDQAFGAGGLITSISINIVFIGLALILLFGSQKPRGRFFKGLLVGLGNLPSTILGSISAFGDIISYVRLFAMGLAGAEIARAFNGMASELLSGYTFIFGVLILLIGHVFNFVLCTLGVLVHGIRLKMLEFSGRLGIQWSGVEYNPFSARRKILHPEAVPAEKRN